MGHRFEHHDVKANIQNQRFYEKKHNVSGLLFFPECKRGLEMQLHAYFNMEIA